jgi:hypothetical protein
VRAARGDGVRVDGHAARGVALDVALLRGTGLLQILKAIFFQVLFFIQKGNNLVYVRFHGSLSYPVCLLPICRGVLVDLAVHRRGDKCFEIKFSEVLVSFVVLKLVLQIFGQVVQLFTQLLKGTKDFFTGFVREYFSTN